MNPVVLLALAALAGAGAIAVAAGDDDPSPVRAARTPAPAKEAAAAAGLRVFHAQGCASCHAFAPAGSTADAGPDLASSLKGKSRAYVIESIVAPDQATSPGFENNLGFMPSDYGKRMTRAEIETLADFLLEGAGA